MVAGRQVGLGDAGNLREQERSECETRYLHVGDEEEEEAKYENPGGQHLGSSMSLSCTATRLWFMYNFEKPGRGSLYSMHLAPLRLRSLYEVPYRLDTFGRLATLAICLSARHLRYPTARPTRAAQITCVVMANYSCLKRRFADHRIPSMPSPDSPGCDSGTERFATLEGSYRFLW